MKVERDISCGEGPCFVASQTSPKDLPIEWHAKTRIEAINGLIKLLIKYYG